MVDSNHTDTWIWKTWKARLKWKDILAWSGWHPQCAQFEMYPFFLLGWHWAQTRVWQGCAASQPKCKSDSAAAFTAFRKTVTTTSEGGAKLRNMQGGPTESNLQASTPSEERHAFHWGHPLPSWRQCLSLHKYTSLSKVPLAIVTGRPASSQVSIMSCRTRGFTSPLCGFVQFNGRPGSQKIVVG